MTAVDYLVVGHVARDLLPDGDIIGGTVTYSAITAQRLGLRAAIATAAEESFAARVRTFLPEVVVHNQPSPQTTTFENIYTGQGRIQYLRARAEPLNATHIPAEWWSARIVHLGPIAQELDTHWLTRFPHSLVALTPQGWLRQWDGTGRVTPQRWADALAVLRAVDVLIFSPEDVGNDWETIRAYTRAAPLSVLTLERHGVLVFQRDEGRWVAPREANVVDPTGAGDVFAAAFLVSYSERRDPIAAARFANVVASFSIEARGVDAIPTRASVEEWLNLHSSFQA